MVVVFAKSDIPYSRSSILQSFIMFQPGEKRLRCEAHQCQCRITIFRLLCRLPLSTTPLLFSQSQDDPESQHIVCLQKIEVKATRTKALPRSLASSLCLPCHSLLELILRLFLLRSLILSLCTSTFQLCCQTFELHLLLSFDLKLSRASAFRT